MEATAEGGRRVMASCGPFCCFQFGVDLRRELAVSKWVYCILFTVVQVVTWLLRTYGETTFNEYNVFGRYCSSPGSSIANSALCSGQQVVLRFSFATFSFFMLHFILLFWCKREQDPRIGLHTSLWFWKVLLWAGGLVGFLFVPGEAIFYYGQIARFGTGLFLVFVMVEMVTWTYDINEVLVAKDNWWSWTLLVLGALLTFCGGLAAIGASYYFYATSGSCSLNLFFISWSIVIGLAMAGVLFLPRRLEVAGLLTSGVVFLYCSYLLISAFSSQPLNECIRDTGVAAQWITVSVCVCGLGGGACVTGGRVRTQLQELRDVGRGVGQAAGAVRAVRTSTCVQHCRQRAGCAAAACSNSFWQLRQSL